jgi:hypothetical protein
MLGNHGFCFKIFTCQKNKIFFDWTESDSTFRMLIEPVDLVLTQLVHGTLFCDYIFIFIILLLIKNDIYFFFKEHFFFF